MDNDGYDDAARRQHNLRATATMNRRRVVPPPSPSRVKGTRQRSRLGVNDNDNANKKSTTRTPTIQSSSVATFSDDSSSAGGATISSNSSSEISGGTHAPSRVVSLSTKVTTSPAAAMARKLAASVLQEELEASEAAERGSSMKRSSRLPSVSSSARRLQRQSTSAKAAQQSPRTPSSCVAAPSATRSNKKSTTNSRLATPKSRKLQYMKKKELLNPDSCNKQGDEEYVPLVRNKSVVIETILEDYEAEEGESSHCSIDGGGCSANALRITELSHSAAFSTEPQESSGCEPSACSGEGNSSPTSVMADVSAGDHHTAAFVLPLSPNSAFQQHRSDHAKKDGDGSGAELCSRDDDLHDGCSMESTMALHNGSGGHSDKDSDAVSSLPPKQLFIDTPEKTSDGGAVLAAAQSRDSVDTATAVDEGRSGEVSNAFEKEPAVLAVVDDRSSGEVSVAEKEVAGTAEVPGCLHVRKQVCFAEPEVEAEHSEGEQAADPPAVAQRAICVCDAGDPGSLQAVGDDRSLSDSSSMTSRLEVVNDQEAARSAVSKLWADRVLSLLPCVVVVLLAALVVVTEEDAFVNALSLGRYKETLQQALPHYPLPRLLKKRNQRRSATSRPTETPETMDERVHKAPPEQEESKNEDPLRDVVNPPLSASVFHGIPQYPGSRRQIVRPVTTALTLGSRRGNKDFEISLYKLMIGTRAVIAAQDQDDQERQDLIRVVLETARSNDVKNTTRTEDQIETSRVALLLLWDYHRHMVDPASTSLVFEGDHGKQRYQQLQPKLRGGKGNSLLRSLAAVDSVVAAASVAAVKALGRSGPALNICGTLYLGKLVFFSGHSSAALPVWAGMIQSLFPFILAYAVLFNAIFPLARKLWNSTVAGNA